MDALTEQALTPEEIEAENARAAQIEAAMREEGINPEEGQQVDYFGFDETFQLVLPDGKSIIEHKSLTEGDRRKYLNAVNRDVRLNRASGDAILSMQPGTERLELLKAAICGWNLIRNGVPLLFNAGNLQQFLDKANPKIIDLIEKDVRKHNSWLNQNVTIEDIDGQIEDLTEQRKRLVEEAEGKVDSSNI